MQINEPDDQRRKRLVEYEVCKRRGHEPEPVALGEMSVCRFCKVRYKWVMEEERSTLPTGVNVVIEGTNMTEWRTMPLPPVESKR